MDLDVTSKEEEVTSGGVTTEEVTSGVVTTEEASVVTTEMGAQEVADELNN